MNPDTSLEQLAWSQLWQLTAVMLAVGVITALCCRRRPHLAYALGMIVVVKGLTPPLWTSNLSAFGRLPELPSPTWWEADGDMSRSAAGTVAQPERAAAGEAGDVQPVPAGESPTETSLTAPTWSTLWAIGATALVGIAAVMIVRRNGALAAGSSEPDPPLVDLVGQLARQLSLRAAPPVIVSEANMGPAVCGLVRAKLILPRCVVEGATLEQLRPMIMHELVHLRRGDNFVSALQFAFQAIWWFHPLAWSTNRMICRLRESCCDAEAVAALGEPPRRYAQALVDVLEAKQRVRPVFGLPGVRPVEVTARRVKEVLTMSDRFFARTPVTCWIAALVAGALVLPAGRPAPLAAAQATAKGGEAEAKKPAKPVLLLKYGDGKADGKKSIGGSGEMIRFTLPAGQDNALKALRIHCARYGHPQPPKEEVEITILSEDMTESLHTELVPYALFKRQAEARWTSVPMDDPVDVPQTFWVVLNFNAEATKGVYVSYDTSTKGEYSRVGFNDQDAKETDFKGDWMVQAVLEK